jgi:hypothetical protein
MFELWGLRRDYFQREIGGSFDPEDTRERVATFSTEGSCPCICEGIGTHVGSSSDGSARTISFS